MKAVWNNQVIAHSPTGLTVEGNAYFPPASLKREFLVDSTTHTTCHWKGIASYYDIVVDGETNRDAAWTYPDPSTAAAEIKDYVAFWRGVEIVPEAGDAFPVLDNEGGKAC